MYGMAYGFVKWRKPYFKYAQTYFLLLLGISTENSFQRCTTMFPNSIQIASGSNSTMCIAFFVGIYEFLFQGLFSIPECYEHPPLKFIFQTCNPNTKLVFWFCFFFKFKQGVCHALLWSVRRWDGLETCTHFLQIIVKEREKLCPLFCKSKMSNKPLSGLCHFRLQKGPYKMRCFSLKSHPTQPPLWGSIWSCITTNQHLMIKSLLSDCKSWSADSTVAGGTSCWMGWKAKC